MQSTAPFLSASRSAVSCFFFLPPPSIRPAVFVVVVVVTMSTTSNAVNAVAPTSEPKPLPSSETVNKVLNVPLVSDSLKYAQDTLKGYPQLQNITNAGGQLALGGLRAVEPIASHFTPQLKYVDGLASKGLDLAQSKVPYVFKATPSDVAKDVKGAPAAAQANATALVSSYTTAITDSIHKTYSDRVIKPATDIQEKATTKFDDLKAHNDYVKAALDKLTALQATLSDRLLKAKKSGKELEGEAGQEAEKASKSILTELDKLKSFVLSLPSEAAARFHPIKDTLTNSYTTLAKEASEPGVAYTTKLTNIVNFVRGQALPALQKALQHPDAAASPAPQAEQAAERVANQVDAVEEQVAGAGNKAKEAAASD